MYDCFYFDILNIQNKVDRSRLIEMFSKHYVIFFLD